MELNKGLRKERENDMERVFREQRRIESDYYKTIAKADITYKLCVAGVIVVSGLAAGALIKFI